MFDEDFADPDAEEEDEEPDYEKIKSTGKVITMDDLMNLNGETEE
jgi:hypothetical protein